MVEIWNLWGQYRFTSLALPPLRKEEGFTLNPSSLRRGGNARLLPTHVSPSNSYSSLPTEPSHHPPPRLYRPTLANSVHYYFEKGLAPATQWVYSSSQRQFLSFCSSTNQSPLSASQDTLCSFVAELADKGLKYHSVKLYLASIRNLHITQCLPPLSVDALPRLQLVNARHPTSSSRHEGLEVHTASHYYRDPSSSTGLLELSPPLPGCHYAMGSGLPMLLWVPLCRRNLYPSQSSSLQPSPSPVSSWHWAW